MDWKRKVSQAVVLGIVLMFLLYASVDNRQVHAGQSNIVPGLLQLAPTGDALYVSFSRPGKIGNIEFDGSDILVYRERTGTWSLYFDGSDVGTGGQNISAFELLADDSILITFTPRTLTLPELGQITHTDIVRFIPKNVGRVTRGRFELFLKGLDVGLSANAEAIDALAITPDGRLAISTFGRFNVTGANGDLAGEGQDVIALTVAESGDLTASTWKTFAKGTHLELNERPENISALWVNPADSSLYLGSRTRFAVPGLNGDARDIFIARPSQPGLVTRWDFQLYLDGESLNLKDNIDGLALAAYPLGPSSPFYHPRRR